MTTTKDPARDFAAYAPSHHWFRVETYFHESEYGFRIKYQSGTVVEVGVHRDRGDTKWTAEVKVSDGPHLYAPEKFKTKRSAQVWCECALQPALDAAAEYRAMKAAQAEELQPYKDAATEAARARDAVATRLREAESAWVDARCEAVTIPAHNLANDSKDNHS